jgi:hypothetical protein
MALRYFRLWASQKSHELQVGFYASRKLAIASLFRLIDRLHHPEKLENSAHSTKLT